MKRRKTEASLIIQDLLKKNINALSHQDIQKKIGDLCNRSTIYRVLDRLVEDGKVHRLVDMDGIFRFASCETSCDSDTKHIHHHIHFSCSKCKKITCLDDVIPEFNLPKGFLIEQTNFTVSGICGKCSKKEIN